MILWHKELFLSISPDNLWGPVPQRVCFICLTSQGLVTLVTGLIKLVLFPNFQYLKKKIIPATISLEENTLLEKIGLSYKAEI